MKKVTISKVVEIVTHYIKHTIINNYRVLDDIFRYFFFSHLFTCVISLLILLLDSRRHQVLKENEKGFYPKDCRH